MSKSKTFYILAVLLAALLIAAIYRWIEARQAETRATILVEEIDRTRRHENLAFDHFVVARASGNGQSDTLDALLRLLGTQSPTGYPDRLDALLAAPGGTLRDARPITILHDGLRARLKVDKLAGRDALALHLAGIHALRVVDELNPGCADLSRLLREADGAIRPEDIFLPPEGDPKADTLAGGCGTPEGTETWIGLGGTVLVWDSRERDSRYPPTRLLAFGLGRKTRFPDDGGTPVPLPHQFSDRHPHAYGRYIALFEIPSSSWPAPAKLWGIVDPAGQRFARLDAKADPASSAVIQSVSPQP